jgi:hypothetical protein
MTRYRCFAEVRSELNEKVLIGMVGVFVESGETNGAMRDRGDPFDYLFRRTS